MFYTWGMRHDGDEVAAGAAEPGEGWWQVSRDELVAGLREREGLIRRAQAEQARILAEMDARGVMSEFGYATLQALQGDVLRISRGDARKRVARARACHARADGSGEIPAPAPQTAEAALEGALGAEHVEAITAVVAAFPAALSEAEHGWYEGVLVDLAREAKPEAVRKAGRHLLARVDQDGQAPKDEELARPARELRLQWRRDGRLGLSGALDAETGHALETALSPLSKPRPAEDGQPDARPVQQRQGDALAELIQLVLTEGNLPTEGGEKPVVTVTMDLGELLRLSGAAGSDPHAEPPTMHGWTITPEQARRMACDAKMIPVVLGSQGEVLDLGRQARTVSLAQRRALNLRDGGCIFPSCTRPPRWCQAHHIVEWAHGGVTELANLTLLCTEHHRLIHHSEWQVHTGTDQLPYCTPPPYLDPRAHPTRNHTHHPLRHAA